ncbi:hypothetical protein MKW94_004831 [Papaver nudicaule]|uniref:TraB family protein n=1 Tax=Papaver nudicaule TaxID=74823 RepID=A0AA41SMQ8_PAPNU|nr:hypothetical protein [Papaver nudicaule]
MSSIINNHQQTSSSSSSSAQDPYQHGIPEIPTDGRVVLLQNSKTGALVYLVGTVHVCKESAELVKKVIDYVRPDVVAVELCKGRAERFMNWKPKDETLYKLFRKSMRAPGGLCMKLDVFFLHHWYRRLHANGIFPGLEFKVAMEESFRVGATCFYIDQDNEVTRQQLSKLSSFDLLQRAIDTLRRSTSFKYENFTRSTERKMFSIQKKQCPKIYKVMIEDRDKIMFTNLISFQGKVVAVVGMSHMDGIELLWKRAEEVDNSSICITIGT